MKEAQEIVKDWLESLKEAYPHLPDNLPTDKEKENLLKLERWFKHIEELREYYDDVGKKELDEKYQDEPGRRQIIPVLMSLDDMSPEEVKAWHEMFICLAASMVHLSFGYWNTHNGQGDATLDLGDLLGYLPVVFLYVLSSYKPYPSDKRFSREHERVAYEKENDLTEKEIAKIDKSRIKLITWVYTESRRHINTYMQQIAYNIKYGSGYTHRLQQLILDIVNTYETDEGRYPTDEEVVTELRKTRYGKLLKKESLMKHVRFLKETKAGNYDTVSLYNPSPCVIGVVVYPFVARVVIPTRYC